MPTAHGPSRLRLSGGAVGPHGASAEDRRAAGIAAVGRNARSARRTALARSSPTGFTNTIAVPTPGDVSSESRSRTRLSEPTSSIESIM